MANFHVLTAQATETEERKHARVDKAARAQEIKKEVWGLGFKVSGLGFKDWGLGFKVWVSG